MSWTRSARRPSHSLFGKPLGRSRSDAANRRRRLFLEQLENRSVLNGDLGNGLSAQPDSYTFDEDTTLNVSAPGVLANDSGTSAVLLSNPLSLSP